MYASPSGSFKRPSEYIKDGFDWVFGKLDDNLADVCAGLADIGAPVWLQNGIDQLAWNAKMSVGIVEGAINGVVGLGELIWDVATDPIGVGGAIVDGVCDGATSAWEWGSKGGNWTKAANDSWEWASDGDNWTKAAKDADQWLNDNPRVVGNVTGEVLLEVGAAALTGGSSLGASAVKKGGKELVEESLEYGTKKLLKEGGEEVAEQRLKKNLPEVITKKGGDPLGTRRNSAGQLIDAKTGKYVKDPNKAPKKTSSTPSYQRDIEERRKALLRDADDPNSGLSDEARKFIKENDGKKVPEDYEVSHEQPFVTSIQECSKNGN